MSKPHVLVVGGAGYIGSHMVLDLLRADYPVVTLDDLSRGHRELVPGGDFIEGDMGNPADLERVFRQYPIKAVRRVRRATVDVLPQ
jgi:UDP-glucose 4-epimerase